MRANIYLTFPYRNILDAVDWDKQREGYQLKCEVDRNSGISKRSSDVPFRCLFWLTQRFLDQQSAYHKRYKTILFSHLCDAPSPAALQNKYTFMSM